MVEHVQQSAAKAEDRQRRNLPGQSQNSGSQAKGDDPDVFHAVIGQQPLQVMLRQGKEHSADPGNDAHDHQNPAHPHAWLSKQEQGAKQAVDARFDHHAGHQGGNVAGRGGMGFRQPDVEGDEARLDAESKQRQPKKQRHRLPAMLRGGDADKIQGARASSQNGEKGEEGDGSDMRGDKIGPARFPHLRVRVVVHDQKERGEGHHFPNDKEKQRAVRGQKQQHAGDKQVVKKPVGAGTPARTSQIGASVDQRQRRNQQHRQAKEGGK